MNESAGLGGLLEMKKLAKLVVGSALLGAAAYGAHAYLNRMEQEEDIFEPDDQDSEQAASYTELEEAANRAYTTIQHGSRQAMEKMKEAVGPKGGEVIDEISAAAREMGKTVMDSADKIKDILQSKEESEVPQGEESEEAAVKSPEEEKSEEAGAAAMPETSEDAAGKTLQSAVNAEAAAAVQAEELAKAADAGRVEEFFDDEEAFEG